MFGQQTQSDKVARTKRNRIILLIVLLFLVGKLVIDFVNIDEFGNTFQQNEQKAGTEKAKVKREKMIEVTEMQWFKDYVALHNSITQSSDLSKQKFVAYQCRGGCGGLGDRLHGMISAFMFAIITNRAILIDMRDDWGDWIDNEYMELTYANAVPSDKGFSRRVIGAMDYATSLQKSWSTDDLEKEFEKYNLVTIQTNQNAFQYILDNPHYAERLQQMDLARGFKYDRSGTQGFHPSYHKYYCVDYDPIFATLSSALFQKTPKLKEALTTWKRDHGFPEPGSTDKTLCIHLRYAFRGGGNFAVDGLGDMVKPEWFWECAELYKSKTKKWFVASDYEPALTKAKETYGDLVDFVEGKPLHIDRNRVPADSRVKLWLDYFMFEECDASIVSPSGFSRTAIYRHNPFYCPHIGNNATMLGVVGKNFYESNESISHGTPCDKDNLLL